MSLRREKESNIQIYFLHLRETAGVFFIKDIRYYTLASKAAKEAASKSKVDISNVFAQIERLASDAERERQNMQSLRESWRKEKERNEKLEKEIIQLKKKNKKLMKQL